MIDHQLRQYTLRRLLCGLTIVGLVFGFASTFPVATASLFTVNLLLLAPSAGVFAASYWLSANRERTSLMLTLGIAIGWIATPQVGVYWRSPPTFWDQFILNFETFGLSMLVGAIAAGVVDFLVGIIMIRKAHQIGSVE